MGLESWPSYCRIWIILISSVKLLSEKWKPGQHNKVMWYNFPNIHKEKNKKEMASEFILDREEKIEQTLREDFIFKKV